MTGGVSPKSRNPPTSRKQMRKLGEPQRKICRVAEQQMEDDGNSEAGKSTSRPPPGVDGPPMRKPTSPSVQNGNKRQATRIRKEEYRTKRELKAKMRKEKAKMKEKKKKEQEETLRKKGERLIRNQPKIVEWLRSDDKRQRKTRKGKKGIG